jgi:hypothetical protein
VLLKNSFWSFGQTSLIATESSCDGDEDWVMVGYGFIILKNIFSELIWEYHRSKRL